MSPAVIVIPYANLLSPVLERLRLWRVHYPGASSPSCIFSEYEGYIDLDYHEGSVPGTPSAEVVTVLSLQPKTGGTSQSFVFAGLAHFDGAQKEDMLGTALIDTPDGGFPSPVYALWKPTLEPDREYCATLTLYGRNDQAMPAVISNSVCTSVTNLDARPGQGDAGVATTDATTALSADALPTSGDALVSPADALPTSGDALISPADAESDQPVVVIHLDASPTHSDVSVFAADAVMAIAAEVLAAMPDATPAVADAAFARPDAGIAPADPASAITDATSTIADASPQPPTRSHSSGCSCSLGGNTTPGPMVLLWAALFLFRTSRRRIGGLQH